MTQTFARLRRSRIALTLALLAVVAQFGLALASTSHHARMVVQDNSVAGEVCTVAGVERPSPSGDRAAESRGVPSPEARPADCAVCAASGLLAAPAAPTPGIATPPAATASGPADTDAPLIARFDPLPPSRAPPLVS